MNENIIGESNNRFHGFDIQVEVNLYGTGITEIDTKINFLDHMLQLFAKHGGFDIKVSCDGDYHVDDHHTIDEIAMNLGLAFKNAISKNKKNINRFGFWILPMDEALTTVSIDVKANRFSYVYDVEFHREKIGDMSIEMFKEFWNMFAQKLECNLVIKSEYGTNDHHIAEVMFKCVARAIKFAVT